MAGSKTITKDLTSGSVSKQLLVFAYPIMLSNVFQTVYSLIDMLVVGRVVGTAGLSAVGVGAMVVQLISQPGFSIGHAGQIMISQQVGAKDKNSLGYTVGTIITLEVIVSILISILGIIFRGWAVNVMHTPYSAQVYTNQYLLVCSCGMLFVYGYNAVSAILRGLGESTLPMVIIGIAQVINLVLDIVFVKFCHLDVMGAALATIISQAAALIGSLVFLLVKRDRLGFDIGFKHLLLKKKYLMPMVKVGLPFMAQGMLISISMTYINSMINVYGVTASAVDTVGQKLQNIFYIGIDGMAVGSGAMVAQCFGAGDHERIRKIVHSTWLFCFIFCAAVSAISVVFSKQIFWLFDKDAEVIAMAPHYIWVAVVYAFAAASMCATFSVTEGVGNATLSMIASIADGVVARIGLGLLMGHFFGLYGFWFGSASAGFVTTIITGIYYFSNRWTLRKPLVQSDAETAEN